MAGFRVLFSYLRNGRISQCSFSGNHVHPDFTAEVSFEPSANPGRFRLSIDPEDELTILSLMVRFDFSYQPEQRIFVNGYQSWTDSREFAVDEKIKGIPWYAAPVKPKFQIHKYGDYTFKKYPSRRGVFHGYTYSYVRAGEQFVLFGSLSERNGFTRLIHDAKKGLWTLEKDCAGLRIVGRYEAFDMARIEGEEDFVFDTYFKLLGIDKPRTRPMTGWTSWYNYYQNINEAVILENLDHFGKLEPKIDIFQIDDGYQTAVGDWLSVDPVKFPRGMGFIAGEIGKCGFKAGLWLAPFACETKSDLFREHPDWVVRNPQGRPLLAGSNWSRFYALDFYHPEVRDHLKKVFATVLNEWGYDLVKLDFLYAVCLQPRPDKTRGGIMSEAMEFLRECVGDKLILGCGVPLGPAFGRVDYCRIGSDVGLDWNDKWHRRLLRERVSTYNAIGNAIGRRHLDGRAFLNDPDVFLLRNDNIQLTAAQKNTLLTANTTFGSLLFTSDNIGHYDGEQRRRLKAAFMLERKCFERVERNKNDLVEIAYTENGEKRLVLMNLSGKTVAVPNKWGCLEQLNFNDDIGSVGAGGNIKLDAFESRSFRMR